MSETLITYNFPQDVYVDEHTRVRIMEPTDADRIREILEDDPDIRNHMGWMSEAYTTEELAERIQVMRDGRNARYVVTEDELVNAYLGMWPSWKSSNPNEFDLGYFTARWARGRHLIRKAGNALMDAAEQQMDISNFTVYILEKNTASQSTAAGLGFVATEELWKDPKWGIERRYVRLRNDQATTS